MALAPKTRYDGVAMIIHWVTAVLMIYMVFFGEDLMAEGEAIEAAFVLLTTGVVDIKPDLPGLDEAIRRGLVRICPICDAFEAIDKRIAVLTDSDLGLREALFLRTYSPNVTVLNLGPAFADAARRAAHIHIANAAFREKRAPRFTGTPACSSAHAVRARRTWCQSSSGVSVRRLLRVSSAPGTVQRWRRASFQTSSRW